MGGFLSPQEERGVCSVVLGYSFHICSCCHQCSHPTGFAFPCVFLQFTSAPSMPYCEFLEENTEHVPDLLGSLYLMFLGFRKW